MSERYLSTRISPSFFTSNPEEGVKQVGAWLRSYSNIAESSFEKAFISKSHKLDEYWHLPSFRLAVVGELNRGKSAFINRLLDKTILPSDMFSNTHNITSIVSGLEEKMEIYTNNQNEVHPLKRSSWNNLSRISLEDNQKKAPAWVHITVDSPWLKSIDIELIDTPAAGEPDSEKTALISNLLSQCDATVLVVSAEAPFSATESAFLKREVIGQYVPRVLVVVSKLDNVPKKNRQRLLETIKARITEVSDAIPVLSLHSVDAQQTLVDPIETVRSSIEELAKKANRRAWRGVKVSLQIADYLSQLARMAEEVVNASEVDKKERDRILHQMSLETSAAILAWGKVEIEIDKRRIGHSTSLRRYIDKRKENFLSSFLEDLNKKENVSSWWEHELSGSMHSLLDDFDQEVNKMIIEILKKDFEWLRVEIEKAFNTGIEDERISLSREKDFFWDLQKVNFSRARQQAILGKASDLTPKIIESLGAGILAPAVVLTSPPLSVAIVVSSFALGESAGMLLKNSSHRITSEQRKIAAVELERAFERIFSSYFNSADSRLRNLYEQTVKEIKDRQHSWTMTKKAVFRNSQVAQDRVVWMKIADRALSCRQEIMSVLEESII